MSDLSDAVFKGHLAGEAIRNDGNITNAIAQASLEAKMVGGFAGSDDLSEAEAAVLEAKVAAGVAEDGDDYNDVLGDILEAKVEGDIAEGFINGELI